MNHIVYFDSGTTNSRAYLLDKDGRLLDKHRVSIGSKDAAIAGKNDCLLAALHGMYRELLKANGLADGAIDAIYASGMATSPYGIAEIAHIKLPIALDALAFRMQTHMESRFFHRSICLIPGLKTENADIRQVNNVRGEEMEVLGAMERIEAAFGDVPVAVVLPGSHTHVIIVQDGRFTDILSTFTGELYAAVLRGTILAPVLNAELAEYDDAMLRCGVRSVRELGLNRALYICHAMRMLNYENARAQASYGEGVLLGGLSQAIDERCKAQWRNVKHFVILTDAKMAAVYRTVLEECETEFALDVLPMDGTWIPSLEGLRRILRVKGEMENAL